MQTYVPPPVSRLTCGFCGFVSPHFNGGDGPWAPYFRAVYYTGPEDLGSEKYPRLSGLGLHLHQDPDNYVPAERHQRYDDPDLDSLHLIRVRDIRPPSAAGGALTAQELATYSWGFLFHDACWSLLEQAVKPGDVDVKALWRILVSVPCGSELPNWGHNYGGLYMGTAKDQARGEHFVLMGPNSNVVIPSTFWNPFKVRELNKLVADSRIKLDDEKDGGDGSSPMQTPPPNAGIALVGAHSTSDPFSKLPQELRELLICYLASADVANVRLASRKLATTPLTQQFFRSRFWPSRKMHVFFDAFLLPGPEMRGTNWTELYRKLKIRLKYNQVCLGERNRLRIWDQTIKPLAAAIRRLSKMSDLRGGPEWRWGLEDWETEADWKFVRTARSRAPDDFGELGRTIHRAEVELPTSHDGQLKSVCVSLVKFFKESYVTGLRFVFEGDNRDDDVELGYILRGSEEYLKVHDASLHGFYCAVDECGFRALALVTGQSTTTPESPDWAGKADSLTPVPLVTCGNGVTRVRAAFDGFRLQALHIFDSSPVSYKAE